mmetsp:Transcript_7072/g.17532  ORF Transcript_7072/g.17532 Transcript_7072/m.17532 type:complete len:203 (+) Transcript_7072:717-1325(+)
MAGQHGAFPGADRREPGCEAAGGGVCRPVSRGHGHLRGVLGVPPQAVGRHGRGCHSGGGGRPGHHHGWPALQRVLALAARVQRRPAARQAAGIHCAQDHGAGAEGRRHVALVRAQGLQRAHRGAARLVKDQLRHTLHVSWTRLSQSAASWSTGAVSLKQPASLAQAHAARDGRRQLLAAAAVVQSASHLMIVSVTTQLSLSG